MLRVTAVAAVVLASSASEETCVKPNAESTDRLYCAPVYSLKKGEGRDDEFARDWSLNEWDG